MGGVLGALVMAGCGDNLQVTTMRWYQAPCVDLRLRMCAFERTTENLDQIVYEGTVGYEPIWGVETDLEYWVEDPGDFADALPVRHVTKILATRTVPVGTTTRWYQRAREPWFTAAGDGVEVLRTAVACEPSLCAELTQTPMTANRAIDIEYTGDAAVPLRALTIATP